MAVPGHCKPPPEHPFAQYVRILGKGKSGTRSLDQREARDAFGMLLRGEAEPVQLGAFLMLLRVKEESSAELAGFIQACREAMIPPPAQLEADLDWSSYAGKKHQHPWYLLSILLLVQAGHRVFIHGAAGHTADRLYTEQAMLQLGLPVAASWRQVETQLESHGLSYLSLKQFCAGLHDMMQLKPILGLRSPVNTLARILNPLAAPASIQSIFHPAFAARHLDANRLLGQPRSLVFKGESGEIEVKPQADTRLMFQHHGEASEQLLPRQIGQRLAPVATPQLAPLRDLWRGDLDDVVGLQATLSTTAAALCLLTDNLPIEQAISAAGQLWQNRDGQRLG